MSHIFNESQYRALLISYLEANPTRGVRKKLAAAAKCQASYLSQVLNGTVHLTPDQAFEIARFMNLTQSETEFFMTLVQHERAASKSLREYYAKKLSTIKSEQQPLHKKLGADKELEEKRERYYSGWYNSAIHILLSIPEYNSVDTVSVKLQLPPALVQESFLLLEELALIERGPDGWKTVEFDLHIPSNSPLIVAHHLNWRMFAGAKIQEKNSENLHYTAVHSLSKKDSKVLHDKIVDFIRSTRSVVEISKEEELVAISIDYLRFPTLAG